MSIPGAERAARNALPMEYQPVTAVWELTMACNLRCMHCGSSCTTALPGELTTDEALSLCDQIAALGVRWVTFSGGEPLLRDDWHRLAARLRDGGVGVTMISNGWLVDDQVIERASASGVELIAISIDGLEATHDAIRKPGSFAKALRALSRMRNAGFPSAVISTLLRRNLPELPRMRDAFYELDVRVWQLQLGSPMGNLRDHPDEIVQPEQVFEIIELAEQTANEGRVRVDLGDCLGYFTKRSEALRFVHLVEQGAWNGCNAGKAGFGIRHDGAICGCNSIREAENIEGNVRDTSLAELWTRPGAFAWSRDRSRASLSGFCRLCKFGDRCLAGCTSNRRSLGCPDGEYSHCVYRQSVEAQFPKVDAIDDRDTLLARGGRAVELQLFEIADRCYQRALDGTAHGDATTLAHAAYARFELGDYDRCRELNERALALAPDNALARAGLGLAHVRGGDLEQGIAHLRDSLALCTPDYMDPFLDLAIVLLEQQRHFEARAVLEQGRELSPAFVDASAELYRLTAIEE